MNKRQRKKQKLLWTITVLTAGWPRKGASHACMAVCTSLRHAQRIVESNEWDIHEDNYAYAVIAAIEPNIAYGLVHRRKEHRWYCWEGTPDEGRYVRCATPEQYTHVLFGL